MDMQFICHINLKNNDLNFKEFEVHEYSYNSKLKRVSINSPQKTNFSTNILRISYATARTICSYHADQQEFYFDVISSFFSHLNFIKTNPIGTNDFLLRKDRLNRLRDFSQKTRIGELAQGVNYLFLQERLNYPFIIDYHLFCNKMKLSVSGQSPDYVILNSNLKTIGLFESKGEAAKKSNVNGKLQSAFNQLYNAQNVLLHKNGVPVNKLIPICSKFEFNQGKISSINYCFNSLRNRKSVFNRVDIYKRHYASWFYLVGDFTRATLLNNGEVISPLETEGDISYNYETQTEIYWVSNFPFRQIANYFNLKIDVLYFDSVGFKIGISKKFVHLLINTNIEEIPIQEAVIEGNMQWFRDGTVIQINAQE